MAANTGTNANRIEANNTSTFERSIIDVLTDEAEVHFDMTYAANPSAGIRGAAYSGMVVFIRDRVNTELERVGRPTDGDRANAFRANVMAGVMKMPSVIEQQINYVGSRER